MNSVFFYDGNIYWIACFDRPLSDQEMYVWQTADPLDLLMPDEPLLGVAPPPPPPAPDISWMQTRYDHAYIDS